MSQSLVSFLGVKGLPVVARAEGGYVGKLDDVLVRIEDLSAIGYKLRAPGFWGGARGVVAAAVERLGRDYVIVRDEASVEAAGDSRGSFEDRVWWSDWVGSKCISRRGVDLGKLSDLVLEATGGRVCAFVLDGGRVVVPGPKCAVGQDSVIVDDESVIVKLADAEDSPGWWSAVEAQIG